MKFEQFSGLISLPFVASIASNTSAKHSRFIVANSFELSFVLHLFIDFLFYARFVGHLIFHLLTHPHPSSTYNHGIALRIEKWKTFTSLWRLNDKLFRE